MSAPGKRISQIAADQVLAFIARRVKEQMGRELPIVVIIADENGADLLGNRELPECEALVESVAASFSLSINHPTAGDA